MPVLMPSPVFRWFVPAQNGTGLVPAAGYKAKFFSAGTDIAKEIYELDGTPYPSPSNTAVLNSEGFAGILLGAGTYKLVVTDPDDAVVYTQDDIGGDTSFGTGFVDTVIATDDPPTNGLAQASTDNRFTWCGGYWEIGDGGHGFFWNETSNEPDDGGYVIASTSDPTKRWFREPDEDGSVRAASFGYVGTRAENLTDELLAADSYCSENNKKLIIGPGTSATFGADEQFFSLYSPAMHFEEGAAITGVAGTEQLEIYAILTGPPEHIFVDIPIVISTPQTLDRPEWFGANQNVADNTDEVNAWFATMGGGGSFILPPGPWPVTSLGGITFPESAPVFMLGSFTSGAGDLTGIRYPEAATFNFQKWVLDNGATIQENGLADVICSGRFLSSGLTSTGSVLVTGTVEATGNIESDADVIAGADGSLGALRATAGSSGLQFRAAGNLRTVFGTASTAGGGLDNLLSTTIPADTLVGTPGGDKLKVRAGGTFNISSSPNQRRFVIKVDDVIVSDITISVTGDGSNNDCDWDMQIDIWRDGDGTFLSLGTVTGTNKEASGSQAASDYRFGSGVDWTDASTLQVAAEVIDGAGPIVNHILVVDFFPVNQG